MKLNLTARVVIGGVIVVMIAVVLAVWLAGCENATEAGREKSVSIHWTVDRDEAYQLGVADARDSLDIVVGMNQSFWVRIFWPLETGGVDTDWQGAIFLNRESACANPVTGAESYSDIWPRVVFAPGGSYPMSLPRTLTFTNGVVIDLIYLGGEDYAADYSTDPVTLTPWRGEVFRCSRRSVPSIDRPERQPLTKEQMRVKYRPNSVR